MRLLALAFVGFCFLGDGVSAGEPFKLRRCELIPLPEHQVSFQVDGAERCRWHFGHEYPRPFLFPLVGPSGGWLTRMGHPGAPNHDHHRSVWLAHHDVAGNDFWGDLTAAQIRQKAWSAYGDGDDEAIMASVCGWYDADQTELLEQDVIIAMIPLPENELSLEFQINTRPGKDRQSTLLGKTNFGFLAVRVAKTLSVHFGGGKLTGSDGEEGEKAIFGRKLRWVDYSGPIAAGTQQDRKTVTEGITFFDHPENPRYPTAWHVREDGWMGASFCLEQPFAVSGDKPLVLRYQLYLHRGGYDAAKARRIQASFAARAGFVVSKSTRPHYQFEVQRNAEKK